MHSGVEFYHVCTGNPYILLHLLSKKNRKCAFSGGVTVNPTWWIVAVFLLYFLSFSFPTKTLAATQTLLNKPVPSRSTRHKVHNKDGEEKAPGMLHGLAILSWWQPAGVIFNFLPELPPGFTVIHIWGLSQERSQDAVKFIFDDYYWLAHCKAGTAESRIQQLSHFWASTWSAFQMISFWPLPEETVPTQHQHLTLYCRFQGDFFLYDCRK